jgi:nicotinamide-nucleotide amidase
MDPSLSELGDRAAAGLGDRTIACAESFTAGLIAQTLASADGASEWFCGGIVAYQVRTKRELLGVTADQVVSDEAAIEMARGIAERLDADVGLATTGVGGPDDQDGIPPGTIVIGWYVDGRSGSRTLHVPGDPEEVVTNGARAAMEQLCEVLAPSPARSN